MSDGELGADRLAFHELLLECTEDAIVAVDRDWLITSWNRGAELMYGWTAGEVLGRYVPSFVRMNLSADERAEVRREVAEQGRWRGEATVARKDGSTVSVEVINVAVRDSRGVITGFLGIHRDMTERKLAEQALRDANTRNVNVLESIGDAFFAVDREWRYTYVNERAVDRARRAWGRDVTAEELLGKSCWALFPEHRGTRFEHEFHRALREQSVVQFEAYSAPTDSWVEVRVFPSKDGLSVYSRDVSERRRAEEALHEAKRRSETILESVTDAFAAVDREWRFTYVNERALRRMQLRTGRELTREEVLGSNIWELFSDVVGTELYDKYHQAMRDGRPAAFETYIAPSDDWLEVHLYPSRSGLAIYFRNVSERKRAAAQLAYHAGLLDIVEDAVVGTDAEFRLTVWSGGAERLYGYAAEEVLGRAARDVASYGGDTSRLELEHELVKGDRTRTEITAYRKDGIPVEVELIAVAVRDDEGQVTGYIGTHRDISERKRLEERIAEVREAERSRLARDLHDEALQELTDALAHANLGRSAGMGPEDTEQLVSTLKRVSGQLRRAIYDLRVSDDVSRPFAEALGRLVDVHRAIATECEIELDIVRATSIGVLGDRGAELLRVVGEALTNARRHSGARHVCVTARGSEGALTVTVTDDGRGFDPAGERSGTDGWGIQGMRERTAVLGGDLDIHSTPGRGTTVRIELESAQLHRQASAAARILLVEDRIVFRQAIATMLEDEPDLDVVAQAGSLAEARGMLVDVDVAVVDLGLPDGFGGELISELRDVNPHARTLVLSASLDPSDIARAIANGATASLDKTVELDKLVDTVRRLHQGAAPPT